MTRIAFTPEELALARKIAHNKATALGLTGPDYWDHIQDGYLAACILLNEWSADRDVPRLYWMAKYLSRRIVDLHRSRRKGLRSKQGRYTEVITDQIPEPTPREPVNVDWILEQANAQERIVFTRIMEGRSMYAIGHELGVHPTRVRKIVVRFRRRLMDRAVQ
jgi:DNA-directed RNA polymerase specialized sigma24 family protein